MIDLDSFKLGMRRLASGVALITTRHEGAPHGLIATSITSVSGEPPSLLVCVNRSSSAHDPIIAAGAFCVNLLGEMNHAVARTFSDPERRPDRFVVGEWRQDPSALPRLTNALAVFECHVSEQLTYGSHTIVIGNVNEVSIHVDDTAPLLYVNGSFHRIAAFDAAA